MKNSLKISFSFLLALFTITCGFAQSSKKEAVSKDKTINKDKEGANGGFEKLPSGLEIKIVKHGPGKVKAEAGDFAEMHVHFHIGDSVLFDSRKMNKNEPVPLQLAAPKYHGDPMEGFMKLYVGDSAIMRSPIDSMKKAGAQLAPWMKDGQMFEYEIVLVSLKTAEQQKKETEEKATKQNSVDDKLLQDYFAKNHIKATKTASGLYYKVEKEGTGDLPKAGQSVTVNYTGKTLDGQTFDSNVDSNFHHTQPFSFTLGRGQVIKGWDEGVAIMKKGEKATLYIPSPMAYGAHSPSPKIPADAILMFDVEVTEIK